MTANAQATHYKTLGLTPWANERQIRQSYRELSKRYHPDTTDLPESEALDCFRLINEAYAVLSNPERRAAYDRSIQFSRLTTVRLPHAVPRNAALEYDEGLPSERPLSGGEIFALFVMALAFVGCIALALLVGFLRGDRLLPDLRLLSDLSIAFFRYF